MSQAGDVYKRQLLPSGDKVDASLVGTDSGTDIAVLKVEDQTLKAIDIGSSADLKVGETVIAIGNPGGSALANTCLLYTSITRLFGHSMNDP